MKLCIEKTRMDNRGMLRVDCISCRESFITTLRGHCLSKDYYDWNIGKHYMFYCPHCDFIFKRILKSIIGQNVVFIIIV